MKRVIICLCALVALSVATGCKPTEKNYRAAYEAAQAGKQSEITTEQELGMPKLTSTSGPRLRRVGPDSVYVFREALSIHGAEPQTGLKGYNVAVGKFKMAANAEGDVENLKRMGYDAFVLNNPRNDFFSCVGSFDTLEECAKMIRDFMAKNPKRTYIGLPQAPMVEIRLGSR